MIPFLFLVLAEAVLVVGCVVVEWLMRLDDQEREQLHRERASLARTIFQEKK